VQRFTTELTAAIQTIIARQPQPDVDSPVYRFIAQLNPPRIGAKAEISATNDSKQPPPDNRFRRSQLAKCKRLVELWVSKK
jgi:hypothetical protein